MLGLSSQVDEAKPIHTTTQRDTKVRETRIASYDVRLLLGCTSRCWAQFGTSVEFIMNAKQSRFPNVVRLNMGDT